MDNDDWNVDVPMWLIVFLLIAAFFLFGLFLFGPLAIFLFAGGHWSLLLVTVVPIAVFTGLYLTENRWRNF